MREDSPYKGLPEWPKDAKDLPDNDRAPRERFRWTIALPVLGFICGAIIPGFHDSLYSLGRGTGCAFVGAFLGYLFDKVSWQMERRQWEHDRF